MSALTQQMQNDPSGFLGVIGNHPLFINDPTFTPAVRQDPNSTANREMLKIVGRDRIAFASIAMNPGKGRYEVDITGAQAGLAIACYWLPWRKDSALQLKLKPSKKGILANAPINFIPTRSANDSTSLVLDQNGNWVDRGITGEDPALFFTGMMNGCSLFVSGDAAEPTTYHVNRANYDPTQTAKLLSSPQDRDVDVNKLKSDKMTRDFRTFDNRGVLGYLQKTGQVTPTTQHRRNPLNNTAQDAAGKERSKLIRSMINGPQNQRYRIRAHWITSFGIRTNNKWRFYKQDIYQYSEEDQNGNAVAFSEGTCAKSPTRFF